MLSNIEELESRRDPDVLSIILTTLGAIGSIASIISVSKANQRDRQVDERLEHLERASRANLIDHLANAESALADLSAVLAQVTHIAAASPTERLDELSSPSSEKDSLEFGQHGLLLRKAELDNYLRLQDRAFRDARSVQKAISSALRVLYTTKEGLPKKSFDEFVLTVQSVNAILRSKASTTELLISTQAANDKLKQAVADVRELLSFSPPTTPPTNRQRFGG